MSIPDYYYWYIGAAVIILAVLIVVRKIRALKTLSVQKSVFIEITPPSSSKKTPLATEELFNLVHGFIARPSLKEKLLGLQSGFSFEIVASRHEGIRYLVRLPKEDRIAFEKQISAYLPDIKFRKVKDYLGDIGQSSYSLVQIKQGKHFAYPLATHDTLSQHDPISYITGSMTKLTKDETVALQMIVAPVSPYEAAMIRHRLLVGKDPKLKRSNKPFWLKFILFIISIPFRILRFIINMISEINTKRDDRDYDYQNSTPAFQAMYDSVNDKLAQPLFRTSIRVLVVSEDKSRLRQNVNSLISSLSSFRVHGYQYLRAFKKRPSRLYEKLEWHLYINRLLGLFKGWDSVLSVAEVASLYHFPYGDSSGDDVIRSYSRTLPAPASIKAQADKGEFEVVFGVNKHHGSKTPIGLTAEERARHVYIVGGTGNGKTTLLQYGIIQDIKARRGVAVVDPHGDLAETILKYIPKNRYKDVIYFNPQDLEYPIGLNLLELPDNLTESELALEKDFVTEAIVSIFRKTFSQDDTGGHRIEFVLRNTIHTAFLIPDATLFTLYDLLTDVTYRNSITKQLKDKRLKQFWDNEFSKAGGMQRVKMAAGVTNKLGRFDRSEVVRRVMDQTKSTIDFDNILSAGKILICNFAKGNIGEDTAELFGTTVLAKIQLAALRRARDNQEDRKPFYLYVDEFQHFATPAFLQMLSEARKYKLFLTMAEQSTAQQAEKRLVQVILDNVGTVICFRVRAASEQLLLPIFKPYLESGEISSLSAFNFYIRINGLQTHEPISGETVLLEGQGSEDISEKVKQVSRLYYGVEYKERGEDITENKNKNPREQNPAKSKMKKSLKRTKTA